jgi:hypothetical protein
MRTDVYFLTISHSVLRRIRNVPEESWGESENTFYNCFLSNIVPLMTFHSIFGATAPSNPDLPQKTPPFFSVSSILLFLGFVMCPSGRRPLILYLVFPLVFYYAIYEITWKNIVEPDRPQMTIWRMRVTCWITNATNTQSECVIRLLHFNIG